MTCTPCRAPGGVHVPATQLPHRACSRGAGQLARPRSPRTARSRGTHAARTPLCLKYPMYRAPCVVLQALTLELRYRVGKRKGVLLSLTTTPGALLDAATAGHNLTLAAASAATPPVVTAMPAGTTQAAAAAQDTPRSAASPAQAGGQASGPAAPAIVASPAAACPSPPRSGARKGFVRLAP